jgi:hypothetical protein
MSGAEFEQGWLLMMVHHHQDAVDMSALADRRTAHSELLAFAQRVIAAQTAEIERMRGWAMDWYGFDPLPSGHGGHGGGMPGLPNTGGGMAAGRSADALAPLAAAGALLALLVGGGALRLRRR